MASTFNEDVYIRGALRADDILLPVDCVGDDQCTSTRPITVEKLEHQYECLVSEKISETISNNSGGVVHVALGDGELIQFMAGFIVDESSWSGNAVVDLKKNGTTVLSATITLDAADPVYTPVLGTISTATFVEGDVFSVHTTFTAGTGTAPKGFYASLYLREDQD